MNKAANIKWKKIPAYSPWVGGIWEAAVKAMKRYLIPAIEIEYKKQVQIITAMKLTCAILNSRPLCTYYENGQENLLTAYELVHGVPLELLTTKVSQIKGTARDIFERRQTIMDITRKRLAEEYIVALRNRTTRHSNKRAFREGQLVVYKDGRNRPDWPVAIIKEVFKGKDGQVRSMQIKQWGSKETKLFNVQQVALIPRNENLKLYCPTKVDYNEEEFERNYRKERNRDTWQEIMMPEKDKNQESKVTSIKTHFTQINFKEKCEEYLKNLPPINKVNEIKTPQVNCPEPFVVPFPEKSLSSLNMSDSEEIPNNDKNSKRKLEQGPEEEDFTARRSTKPVKMAKYLWPALMLSLICVVSGQGIQTESLSPTKDYQIYQLSPTMEIYYEDVGQGHVQTGRLRIVQSISNKEKEADKKFIQQIIGNMTRLFENYYLEEIFQEILTFEANDTMMYIQETDNILTTNRPRRFLFGKVLQFVFGVNDEVYEDIEELANQENHISENQKRMHQVIVQTNLEQQENQKKLSEKMLDLAKKVEKTIWDLTFGENQVQDQVRIMTYCAQASYLIRKLKRKYTSLLEPKTRNRLMELQQNYVKFRIMASQKHKLTHNKEEMISIVEHGLYERTSYKLYKVTAIPQIIKDTLQAVKIDNSYIAFKEDSKEYFTMTEDDFKACTEEYEMVYVCAPKFIYNFTTPNCAMTGLYEGSSNECIKATLQKHHLTLKHLLTQNAWLFGTMEPVKIEIICPTNKHNISIERTGILRIASKCFLQMNNTKILGNDVQEIKILNSFTQLHATPLASNHLKIRKIPIDIQLLKHNENFEFEEIPKFKPHQHISYFWSLTLIGIAAATIWVWKRPSKKAVNLQVAVPIPASSSSQPDESASNQLVRIKNSKKSTKKTKLRKAKSFSV